MKRAVLEAPEKIVFQEADKAVPKKGEVLIKVRRMGICGRLGGIKESYSVVVPLLRYLVTIISLSLSMSQMS
ncbi:MAG: hypothetical protein HFG88_12950, partial [Dorea sp.]|nr:hypothetical protein [Dorea sp.]